MYWTRMLKDVRRDLDLERSKSQRLRHQLSSSSTHPDQAKATATPDTPDAEEEAQTAEPEKVTRSNEELEKKYEQLRQTYNKLYTRHKALVTEYKRLHDFLQSKKNRVAPSNGDGVQATSTNASSDQPEVTVTSPNVEA